MAVGASLLMLHQFGIVQKPSSTKQFMNSELKSWRHLPCSFSLHFVRQEVWSQNVSDMRYEHVSRVWYRHKNFKCRCSAIQNTGDVTPLLRNATFVFTRSCYMLFETPVLQLVPAAGMIAFAIWGLAPSLRYIRSLFHNDNNWKKSKTYYISTSYLQPLLLWTGVTLICRVLDPVTLSSETSGAVKQRVLTFVKSLSTVLTFTYCLSSLIQQTQKFFIETSGADETSKMGFRFAGKAIYSAVWVAAVSLFMELLGFSTKKWLTAGGLGTVLITLAGREILTNFLSSIMIHATRPFIANEWIQTKIEGYDVSGCVERVGWWSPTIIRGDDREAIHIPNHKFTVNVVRNLSQKNHWRIKTHLAISHLDVNKISNIVADMRKVLAKNPQIEQQRLHRRVFLDNVDPENQALLIMVSCFVRTSHFEEYLCVKEAVLLDLLRVVSHHKARLATPIRTIQNFYGDPETINIPFPESIFSHAGPMNQSILLIEPPRTNGDDKIKRRSSSRVNGDETAKSTEVKTTPSEATILSSSDKLPEKLEDVHSTSSIPASSQVQNLPKHSSQKTSVLETVTELADGINLPVNTKSEAEMTPSTTVATKSAFEDNIVLGVAFEGSKRTLPIEGIDPPHTQDETNELAVGRVSSSSSASTKDKRDPVMSSDQRDQGK